MHVRWLIRRDMPEVLAIDQGSFDFWWAEEDFLERLRGRNCIGMVAERTHGGPVLGYMIYECHGKFIELLRLAVCPHHRRMGVGYRMAEELKDKLHKQRRRFVRLNVPERNLDAQLFFRAMGFRAVNTFRGFCELTGDDAYRFVYQVPVPTEAEMEECGK